MAADVSKLVEIVGSSRRIVFFGGAGVSTESGIPDFRSPKARAEAQARFGYTPERLLSSDFFYSHPDVFYQYLRGALLQSGTGPNAAHRVLARWEEDGRLRSVITQNIDGLHQMAGSRTVRELHGSLAAYHCTDCGRTHGRHFVETQLDEGTPVPACVCGGALKPEVVLYGEALPEAALDAAVRDIAAADTLIVAGTSLAVQPAASLIGLFQGNSVVVINLSATPADALADLVVRRPVGEVLAAADQLLEH